MTEQQLTRCKSCVFINKQALGTEDYICLFQDNYLKEEDVCTYYEAAATPVDEKQVQTSKIRFNDDRAKYAIWMFYLIMLVSMVSIFSKYLVYDFILRVKNGDAFTTSEGESIDTREQIIAITYMLVFLVSLIVFIRWFRRAYFNLHLRTNGKCKYTEGWAAGGWFVPIVSLFYPFQIMKEMDEKTTNFINNHATKKSNELTGLITGWWMLWVVSTIFSRIMMSKDTDNASLDELQHLTEIEMIDVGVNIIIALLTIILIRLYNNKEQLLVALENQSNTDSLILEQE